MTNTGTTRKLALGLAGLMLAGCSTVSSGTQVSPSPVDSSAVTPEPITAPDPEELTIAFVGRLADEQISHFLDEVAKRSDGALTVAFDQSVDVTSVTLEQTIIEAVAGGELDLGVVGARAFRELGIHDLDALIAPMAIDSMEAQRAVVTSELTTEMLSGLQAHGLIGLALIAGPLRRPVATEPITTLDDFTGVPFYTFHAEVNALTIGALGATHVDSSAEERNAAIQAGDILAYENTLAFLAATVDWPTKTITGNLNLWPATSVLIADPDRLESLTPDQRTALTEAAADTMARAFELIPDETELADQVCAAQGRIATAPPQALAEIEQALTPVHAQLREDPLVAKHLDEIARLTDGLPADSLPVPDGCAAA